MTHSRTTCSTDSLQPHNYDIPVTYPLSMPTQLLKKSMGTEWNLKNNVEAGLHVHVHVPVKLYLHVHLRDGTFFRKLILFRYISYLSSPMKYSPTMNFSWFAVDWLVKQAATETKVRKQVSFITYTQCCIRLKIVPWKKFIRLQILALAETLNKEKRQRMVVLTSRERHSF